MVVSSGSGQRGDEHGFDALVQLGGENAIRVGNVFQRDVVGDQRLRVEHAVADVFDQAGQQALHGSLVAADRETFVHDVAGGNQGVDRPINADDRDDPAFLHRV